MSPLKAAELGVDPCAMQTVLADHVRQHVSELADMVLTYASRAAEGVMLLMAAALHAELIRIMT